MAVGGVRQLRRRKRREAGVKSIYKLLSALGDIAAAFNGNYPRRYVRQKAHKGLARGMRKWGL